jgi:hypothetical protein
MQDVPAQSGPSNPGAPPFLDETWLQNFYKECGRELSLAYGTLNQDTNWAMIIVAALISGLALKAPAGAPDGLIVVGVAVAYAIILRFFVRAILAYINVTRWNTLQRACLELRLLNAQNSPEAGPLQVNLKDKIQNHYFNWLSPINRRAQVLSTLRLSFSLMFALPIFFMAWGVIRSWNNSLVKGALVFAVGISFVEILDFLRSPFFDNVEAHSARASKGKVATTFPSPVADSGYMLWWFIVVVISILVTIWPKLS